MDDQEKNLTPITDSTGDPSIKDLRPRHEPQHVTSPETEAVKGGVGINRLVVTDGKIDK